MGPANRGSNSLLVLLLFPLGMAMGFLLAGMLDRHTCPPCREVHVAHHDLHLNHLHGFKQGLHPFKHLHLPHIPPPTGAAGDTAQGVPSPGSAAQPPSPSTASVAEDSKQTSEAVAASSASTPEASSSSSETSEHISSERLVKGLSGYRINKPGAEVFKRALPPSPLFLTFGSIAMSDFVLNWVAHVEMLNATSKDYLVGCLDKPLLDLCEAKGIPAIAVAGDEGLMKHTEYFRANEKKFLQMGSIKTDLLRGLLVAGYDILISDADVVFMSDPWPWVLPGRATSPAQAVRAASMVKTDVLTTTDCVDEEEDTNTRFWLMNKEFNTGVMFLRGNPRSVGVVDRWKDRIHAEKDQGLYINDQAVFNRAFHTPASHPLIGEPDLSQFEGVPLDQFAEKPKTHRRWYDDKSIRHTYYLPDWQPTLPEGNGTHVSIGVFPMVEFLNGHSFFVAELHKYYEAEAVAVHATYQFGDSPEYGFGKRERLRQAGLWQVDEKDFYEGGQFLHITGDMLDGFVPPEVDDPSGITLHLASDNWQRQRLQDAFLMAKALGRILVLPKLYCYCDRYWWLLHKCRTPGAERMELPFQCPLDHIVEPSRWYQAGLKFRPYGFLDHKLVPEVIKKDRVTMPHTLCPCADHPQVDALQDDLCEQNYWKRLEVGTLPDEKSTELDKRLLEARVLEVNVADLDNLCYIPNKDSQWRVSTSLSMHVGLCGKENNIIPPNWKPETHPLNCSWGYDTPQGLKELTEARRARLRQALP